MTSASEAEPGLVRTAPVLDRPTYSPAVYRLVGDFDGDGIDDVAVGEVCGVHGLCEFTFSLGISGRASDPVGTAPVTYDDVALCPGDPPRLVTILRYGTAYNRAEFIIDADSVRVARVDTSSMEAGGPPDSWGDVGDCRGDLRLFEAMEADLEARGDSAWYPVP